MAITSTCAGLADPAAERSWGRDLIRTTSDCAAGNTGVKMVELDGIVRIAVIVLIAGGMFLGWILLLGGVSAVQAACSGNCRSLTGLSWWIVWLQLFVYLFAVPVQIGKLRILEVGVVIFLAILTTMEMYEANLLLNRKSGQGSIWDGIYTAFGHDNRINATVAGHSVLAAFNVLLILFLGFVPHSDYESSGGNTNNNNNSGDWKAPPMPAGSHPMKPMTSRASSMRASSAAPSEA
ncbi:hypothetical protein WJX73_008140 [Symbiochloris irregularis]|uniref:Uncharacterized protein n=1 Tax=Symbiochloris irregularis TaxID=706552 RepID=A0AAW1NRC3_9CHLO